MFRSNSWAFKIFFFFFVMGVEEKKLIERTILWENIYVYTVVHGTEKYISAQIYLVVIKFCLSIYIINVRNVYSDHIYFIYLLCNRIPCIIILSGQGQSQLCFCIYLSNFRWEYTKTIKRIDCIDMCIYIYNIHIWNRNENHVKDHGDNVIGYAGMQSFINGTQSTFVITFLLVFIRGYNEDRKKGRHWVMYIYILPTKRHYNIHIYLTMIIIYATIYT